MDTYYPVVATAWVCLESLWTLVYDQVRYKGNTVEIRENHRNFCNQGQRCERRRNLTRPGGVIWTQEPYVNGGLWPIPGGALKAATTKCRLHLILFTGLPCGRHRVHSWPMRHFWMWLSLSYGAKVGAGGFLVRVAAQKQCSGALEEHCQGAFEKGTNAPSALVACAIFCVCSGIITCTKRTVKTRLSPFWRLINDYFSSTILYKKCLTLQDLW